MCNRKRSQWCTHRKIKFLFQYSVADPTFQCFVFVSADEGVVAMLLKFLLRSAKVLVKINTTFGCMCICMTCISYWIIIWNVYIKKNPWMIFIIVFGNFVSIVKWKSIILRSMWHFITDDEKVKICLLSSQNKSVTNE
jgi:hypothetical protein